MRVVCNACVGIVQFFFHFGYFSFHFEPICSTVLLEFRLHKRGFITLLSLYPSVNTTFSAITSMVEIKRNMFVIKKSLKWIRRYNKLLDNLWTIHSFIFSILFGKNTKAWSIKMIQMNMCSIFCLASWLAAVLVLGLLVGLLEIKQLLISRV